MAISGVITSLFRYPVKGLSPERMESMILRAGSGLEGDRRFALALGDTVFDEKNPSPLAKTNFLMLARNESLAQLDTSYDAATGLFRALRRGDVLTEGNLQTAEGRAVIGAFFTAFAGDAARGEIKVVAAPSHRFTDIGAPMPPFMNCISLVSLATLRAVEAAIGQKLDSRRFRANVYADGLEPWDEMEWIGKEVTMGGAVFRVVRATRRCPAVNVNPDTAERDADIPKMLQRLFGHPNLGVYLEVMTSVTLQTRFAVVGPDE